MNKSCVNTFEKGIPGSPPVGFDQLNKKYVLSAMRGNLKVLGIGTVVATVSSFPMDRYIRKKKKPFSYYLSEGGLLALEQMTFSNAYNVTVMDPYLKVMLPKLIKESALNPALATLIWGVGAGTVGKAPDYSVVKLFLRILGVPAQKLLEMSGEELEKALEADPTCAPDDKECIAFRQLHEK